MKTWMVMLGIVVVVVAFVGILLWDETQHERESRKRILELDKTLKKMREQNT